MKQQISPLTAIGAIVGVVVLIVVIVLTMQSRSKPVGHAESKDQFAPVTSTDEMKVLHNPREAQKMGK